MRLFFRIPKYLICFVFVIASLVSIAQEQKSVQALRVDEAPEIDGVLNDSCWTMAPLMDGFSQRIPYNGKPATFDTKVRVVYDDKAIYVGAHMLDPHPDSISMILKSRDEIGLADYFGVLIDPYRDGLNSSCFFLTSRNVQVDFKLDGVDEDDHSWNAVWRSATQIDNDGWSAEIMIPYSALRFSRDSVQDWFINFERSIQRLREESTWNFIDSEQSGIAAQSGLLKGIRHIKPPFRLSATPYLSAVTSNNTESNSWSKGYNYGLDLKAGLSESFTLDLTLIPDFGQVESDDRIYSLSPYEIYYDEKRPFFTEGTELFSKGNVFYSRRVGATPQDYDKVNDEYSTEQIIENPENAQLINALKVSGKTNKGLGIGVFNAMTANTYARVYDENGQEKKILTSPFTNFNMFVFEQSMLTNSSVSIYNTNVYQPDNQTAANVSGTDFRLRNKTNRFEFGGNIALSQHYQKDLHTEVGENFLLNIGKVSGKLLYETWFKYVSDDYNPNDMGYIQRNNEVANGWNIKYNIYEPQGAILNWRTRLLVNHYYLNVPRRFQQVIIGLNSWGTFKNQYTCGTEMEYRPFGMNDYFEPRVDGYYLKYSPSYFISLWGSPDYRKTFVIDHRLGTWFAADYHQFSWWGKIGPRWQISDNVLVEADLYFEFELNNLGYVNDSLSQAQQPVIIFGRRDVRNVTTQLETAYIFSRSTSLSFRMRHYWLRVNYAEFYDLQNNGELRQNTYEEDEDFAVNAFNIDMVFKWDFAPGSELLLVWKNAVFTEEKGHFQEQNYFDNFKHTFDSPVSNSFSIKLLYYLDWQYFQRNKS